MNRSLSDRAPRSALWLALLSTFGATLLGGGALDAAELGFDPELLAGLRARAIGPAGMSGRVAAIDAVEDDPNLFYVGAATGGVWKTIDGGMTFEPIFDDQPVAAIGAVAIFQRNPDVVWVGTGEGNVRNSASVGNGVYRSIDAGRTWKHLGLEGTERIHRVRLHPTDPERAIVCAMGRAWGENPERGVYRTDDGGESWRRVLFVDAKTGCADLAVDPSNPDHLIASMWQYRRWPHFFRSGGPGSGVYRSLDGGESWSRYEEMDGMPKGELGRAGIAFSRSQPEIVYALVEAEQSALLRSDDGGDSWRSVNTSPDVAPRPFYYCDIRVDPERPNRVYSLQSSIDVSEDGGRSFRSLIGFRTLHPDNHEMWIDPADGRHLIVGNDGGVGISLDRGATWRFVRNLPLAQFYHVRVDMERPYNVYGGLQDNGSWRGPSAVWAGGFGGGIRNFHWTMVLFGDGFDTAADPEDASRGYAMSQGGNLARWDLRNGGSKDIRPDGPDEVELRFNWNAGFAQDPFDAATIYYGSQFVHKSTDRGESWVRISEDLTSDNEEWQLQEESGGLTLDVTAAENFTTIVAIEPSPLERGVLWVGTDDGRVHVTRDGGDSWTSIEDRAEGVPANTWVPHVTASRFDAGEAFVVFDNHRRSDWQPYVFRVSDYGQRWQRLETEGVEGYALKIEQDLVDEDLLFLGTEFGLWVTIDGGDSWFRWRHGVPTVSVMDMAIHPREHDLVLGTHGRSIFVLDDIRPLRELSAEVMAKPIHLFEIGDALQYQRGASPGELMPGSTEFYGENRPYGALITFALADDELPHPDQEAERERQRRRREERAAGRGSGAEAVAGEAAGGGEARSGRGGPGGPGGRPGGGRGGDGPQAKIEILDGEDEVVRTFRRPIHRGLNRVSWDLRRDGFRRPGRGGGFGPFGGGGPEVLPGEYTVRVSHGESSADGPVRVLADLRVEINDADRLANWQAIERAGALQEAIADAVERISRTRADIDVVTRKLRERKDPEDDTEDESAAEDESAGVAAAEPPEDPSSPAEETESGDEDDASDPDDPEAALQKSATELKKKLDEIEKRLWTPPGTKGITARNKAIHRVGQALGALQSSWEAPSSTHLAYLRQAEAKLQPILDDLNALFAEDVAEFRRAVREASVELLPEHEPLEITLPQ